MLKKIITKCQTLSSKRSTVMFVKLLVKRDDHGINKVMRPFMHNVSIIVYELLYCPHIPSTMHLNINSSGDNVFPVKWPHCLNISLQPINIPNSNPNLMTLEHVVTIL